VFGYSPLVYSALHPWVFASVVPAPLRRATGGLDLAREVGGENELSDHCRLSVIAIATRRRPSAGAGAEIGGMGRRSNLARWSSRHGCGASRWTGGGRGWIALALVVFSGWRRAPAGGAYFFRRAVKLESFTPRPRLSFLPSQLWGGDAISGRRSRSCHIGSRGRRKRSTAASVRPLLPTLELKPRKVQHGEKRGAMITNEI